MKWFMIILLAAFITLVAFAAPVYSDEDEGNEANESDESNEANEDGSGSDSEDDERESTPGFEFAFATAAALAAARLLKARVL